MNAFWLWFWRPIAECLGVLALLALFVAAVFAWVCFDDYVVQPIRRWRQRKQINQAPNGAKGE